MQEFIESKAKEKPKKLLNSLEKWSENDIALISYPNSIIEDKRKPLATLNKFLNKHCINMITIVHFTLFPIKLRSRFFSRRLLYVNENFGSWDDIKQISKKFSIMGDVVLNHGSSKSKWFKNFLNGSGPGQSSSNRK